MRNKTRTKREYNNLVRHNAKTVAKLQRMEFEKCHVETLNKDAFTRGQSAGFILGSLFVLVIHFIVSAYYASESLLP